MNIGCQQHFRFDPSCSVSIKLNNLVLLLCCVVLVVFCPPGHRRAAPVADIVGKWSLSIEDAIPRRYHACHFRAAGFHSPPGGSGATPAGESDPLPRGVSPNSPHRALVTKAGRGRGARRKASDEVEEGTPAARRFAMTRAQRLKRVFRIDVEACQACGGAMRIIASIEDPVVRGKILVHLEQAASGREVVRLPGPRAPPDGWS